MLRCVKIYLFRPITNTVDVLFQVVCVYNLVTILLYFRNTVI